MRHAEDQRAHKQAADGRYEEDPVPLHAVQVGQGGIQVPEADPLYPVDQPSQRNRRESAAEADDHGDEDHEDVFG